jgi:hypothetical protein
MALAVTLALVVAVAVLAHAADPTTAPTSAPTTGPATPGATTGPATPENCIPSGTLGPAEIVSPTEQWIRQVKHPVPWLTWGADERMRENWDTNIALLDDESLGHERHYQRYRTRLWANFTPFDALPDLSINTRLCWEFYNFCKPEGVEGTSLENIRDTNIDECLFDTLNVKYKNAFGLPTTVTVGRQDIILGDGWLVLDGTPADTSRTIYFDAARTTTELKSIQSTVDLIYINQHAREDWWIEPFNYKNQRVVTEQDEQGAILWFANKSITATELDAYFIYKHEVRDPTAGIPAVAVDQGDLYTFGTRGVHDFNTNWQAKGEIAGQFGNKNGDTHCALGSNNRITYFTHDQFNDQFRIMYEYLSGRAPGSGKDGAFDLLWGEWPQWSELYCSTVKQEQRGRGADVTNLHRLGFGWTITPSKNWEYCLDYHLLFRAENTLAGRPGFSDDGTFRGQLVTSVLKYKFTEHLTGHFWAEFFMPGNYYENPEGDLAIFLRYELVFAF